MSIKEVAKDLFTGKDGATHDMGRYSWAGSFLAVLGTTVANIWHGAAIDVMQVAEALGVVSAAHGATLYAKRHTEPDAEPPPA